MSPLELQKVLSSGLLSFPVTDFKANGDLDTASYAKRLEWLAPHGASVLFAAGGTGEFFSLEPKEYSSVIQTAVDTCNEAAQQMTWHSIPAVARRMSPSTRQNIQTI